MMNDTGSSLIPLRIAAQILEALASADSSDAAYHQIVHTIDDLTSLAAFIVLGASNTVISSSRLVIPEAVAENLLKTYKTTPEVAQILAWWPNYADALCVPLQHKAITIGQLALLAPNAEAIPLMAEIMRPLHLGLRVLASEVALARRSQELMTNQYEFVRIVTHDLRSPLTAIHGYASMLESGAVGPLNPKQQDYISRIVVGTSQLSLLIENIADAGRYDPQTGFYELTLVPTDPLEVINKIVDQYLIPREKAALQVKRVFEDDIPIIYADQNMLERAVVNLVDNAVKYTPDGGHVTVRAFTRDDRLYIQVEDTGSGIRSEDIAKLFQRHVRLRNPEHRSIRGAGLGLFIVRAVANRHGGDAFVESELHKGSTFGIWIPLNDDTLVPL